jgi:hypothetical protein
VFAGGGGTRWQSQPFPPPHPSGDFWAKTREFSEKEHGLGKVAGGFSKCAGGFLVNSQDVSFRATWRIFPKSANSLIILRLMIFSRNLFNNIAAQISCLGDASFKKHLPLCGEL